MALRAVVVEGDSELRGYECEECRTVAFREVEHVWGQLDATDFRTGR
jgi:hypothetical protein